MQLSPNPPLDTRPQVLVVDDEQNLRRVLSAQLSRDGYEVLTAADGEEALHMLEENHVDVVVTDLRMPKLDGMGLLRAALKVDAQLPVIMITAHGTIDTAVEALKTGAFDYITKPFDQQDLRRIVSKAIRTRSLTEQEATVPSIPPTGTATYRYGIIGESDPINAIYSVLDRVADTPTTVLVTGESGTGKELVARALHENSSRASRPFIRVNCAAIPKDLMESELFGFERGAFTGAVHSKPGRFELANGGTLFLDEIGTIPIEMQVKLLRVLQEGEFERVGGVKTISVDARLVAATNSDLKKDIADGTFRDDLYYRLNVVSIHLPALRERSSDVPLLVEFFLRKFNQRLKKDVQCASGDTLALLQCYHWPGNIRELENVVERAVLFCDGSELLPEHLPVELRGTESPAPRTQAEAPPDSGTDGLKERVRAATAVIERDLIQRALDQTGGNVTHAARLLKISRKGLQLKLKELGLRDRDDRGD